MKETQEMGFHPWVGKTTWSGKWQPAPVFLPGKFHREKGLAGHSPWGPIESNTTEQLSMQCAKHGLYPVGIGLDYCDIEWFALETNRDHSVIFESASKYCILAFCWPWWLLLLRKQVIKTKENLLGPSQIQKSLCVPHSLSAGKKLQFPSSKEWTHKLTITEVKEWRNKGKAVHQEKDW